MYPRSWTISIPSDPLGLGASLGIATTVGDHTNSCYDVFSSTAQAITLNTITTLDQIDNAYVGL